MQNIRNTDICLLNIIHVTSLLPFSLKASENHCFSDVFRGYGQRPVTWNGLIRNKGIAFGNSILEVFK